MNESIEIIKVWGTLHEEKGFAYIDIYGDESKAREDIGKLVDGFVIKDVIQGWFITGTEELDELSEDFYFDREDAVIDLEDRILPSIGL